MLNVLDIFASLLGNLPQHLFTQVLHNLLVSQNYFDRHVLVRKLLEHLLVDLACSERVLQYNADQQVAYLLQLGQLKVSSHILLQAIDVSLLDAEQALTD